MGKIALVIGHNPRGKGAYSPYLKLSEYEYWENVCDEVKKWKKVLIFIQESLNKIIFKR